MPPPDVLSSLGIVIECIDCATGAVDLIFMPIVHDLMIALREFVLKLRLESAFADPIWWRGTNVYRRGNAYQTICTGMPPCAGFIATTSNTTHRWTLAMLY